MICDINNLFDDENTSELKFTINFGINEGKEYSFKSNETPQIKVGRKEKADIQMVFPEDSTSRVQCM